MTISGNLQDGSNLQKGLQISQLVRNGYKKCDIVLLAFMKQILTHNVKLNDTMKLVYLTNKEVTSAHLINEVRVLTRPHT